MGMLKPCVLVTSWMIEYIYKFNTMNLGTICTVNLDTNTWR